jgi:WD40 repeat protein
MSSSAAARGDQAELFDEPLISRLAGGPRRFGRGWLTDQVKAALDDPECRIVLLTGTPGAGKSAVMAHLAQERPDWPRYFIRRIGETDSDAFRHEGGLASFLTLIGFQLLALQPGAFPAADSQLDIEVDVPVVGPEADIRVIRVGEYFAHPFRQGTIRARLKAALVEGRATAVEIGKMIVDVAAMHPATLEQPALLDPVAELARSHPGERVVVLLDGLDELRFRDAATDVGQWLVRHERFPANLRIVVASRPDGPLVHLLQRGHEQSVRHVPIDADSAEVGQDVEGYLRNLGSESAVFAVLASHGISADRFVRQVASKVGGNFLYASMIARLLDAEAAHLPELGRMAPAPDMDWLERIETLPGDLPRFYALLLWSVHDQLLGRPATRSHWDTLYHPLLGLLSVAALQLTGQQLRAFGEIPLDQAAVDAALERLQFFLDGNADSGFRLHHLSMAEFLADQETARTDPPLYCDAPAWHEQVTDHAIGLHQEAASWRDADPYLRAHLPGHAAECGRLDDLVEDPRYLFAAEPDALVPELGATDRAEPVARVYQQVVPMIRDGDLADAEAHLKLYAQQAGLTEFAARISTDDGISPWQLDYTQWQDVQLRQVLGRHEGQVTAIAVAHDAAGDPIAVTGGDDGQVRIWDLRRGKEAKGSPLPESPAEARPWGQITALAASEADSGEAIAVAGDRDGAVWVWNLTTRKQAGGPLMGAENAGYALAAAVVAGAPQAVCRSGDRLRAWDLMAQAPAGPPVVAEDVLHEEAAAAAGCGDRMVFAAVVRSAGPEATVGVWDMATGELCGPALRTADDWVTAIALAEVEGTLLAAIADGDHGIQVFDVATGQPRTGRPVNIGLPLVDALAMGTVKGLPALAAGHDAGQIILRELPSLRRLGDSVQAHDGPVTALAFAAEHDGRWLASVGKGHPANGVTEVFARFWVPKKSGKLVPAATPIRLARPARSIALASVADRLEAVTTDERRAFRWDVAAGDTVGTPLGGRSGRVCAVGVATVAGRTIAVSATYDTATIRTWDIPDCAPARHPVTRRQLVREDIETVRGLAVTRLGDRAVVACAGWSDIHVWDAATGEPVGPGVITGPKNVLSLAAGELGGRPIVACAVGSPCNEDVMVFDLETGAPLDPSHPGGGLRPEAVAIAEHRGRALIVSGGSYLALRAWEPRSGRDATVIKVAGETSELTATFIGDRPVAVCSGRKGEVRLIDLAASAPSARAAPAVGSVSGLAVAEVSGRKMLLCVGDQGLRVLDLATGDEAAPPPTQLGRRDTLAIAVGTLLGRPVAVAGGYLNHAWYLDSGEPLHHQPAWPGVVRTVTVATAGGRPIAVAGTGERGVLVADLETGEMLGEPIKAPGGNPLSVGVVMVSGHPALVTRTSMGIRAGYLDLPWLPAPEADLPYSAFAALDETPPPPRMFFARRLTRHPHDGGWCMALGSFEDHPLVLSGHDHGEIDAFALDSGLPLEPRLAGGKSSIGAIACEQLGQRPVIAVGSIDGMVRVADLTDLSALTLITTLAPVQALALAEPDHCLIGTEKGLIAARIAFPPEPGQGSGTRGRMRLPADPRAARACPQHTEHRQVAERHGKEVPRLCIKGVQDTWGQRAKHSLRYAGGHCYLMPDRIEILGEPEPPLVLRLGTFAPAPVDDPEAYQTDGCHFGLALEEFVGAFRVLACYRRSERDWLLEAITRRLG